MTDYGSQMVVENYNIMGVAKAALEAAVRYLAAELGPKGIRVHAISPGPLATRAASGIPEFDALLDKANQTLDLKTRGELLRQAEQIALNDFAVSPSRFSVTQDIVEPYVKGWIPNVRDFNRSRWLWIDPHARPERGD